MSQPNYQYCYEQLELAVTADWSVVNKSYRRLVQKWHPDRYTGSHSEQAQDEFIRITQAYNELRTFHKAHGSLPIVPTASAGSAPKGRTDNKNADGKHQRNQKRTTGASDIRKNSDESNRTVLGRRKPTTAEASRFKSLLSNPSLYYAMGLASIGLIVVFLLVNMDKEASSRLANVAKTQQSSIFEKK